MRPPKERFSTGECSRQRTMGTSEPTSPICCRFQSRLVFSGPAKALFTVAVIGIRIYLPPFYALPGFFLRGTAAAGAIGFINTLGNFGGAVGPYVIGAVEKATGGFEGGIYFLCGSITLSAGIILSLRAWHVRTPTI